MMSQMRTFLQRLLGIVCLGHFSEHIEAAEFSPLQPAGRFGLALSLNVFVRFGEVQSKDVRHPGDFQTLSLTMRKNYWSRPLMTWESVIWRASTSK